MQRRNFVADDTTLTSGQSAASWAFLTAVSQVFSLFLLLSSSFLAVSENKGWIGQLARRKSASVEEFTLRIRIRVHEAATDTRPQTTARARRVWTSGRRPQQKGASHEHALRCDARLLHSSAEVLDTMSRAQPQTE